MSGKSRSTTGSPCSNSSVSRLTTSPATLRNTGTSSTANLATHTWPLRRNINPPAQSRTAPSHLVHGRPEAIAVELRGVQFHPLARARGDDRLALVVHVQH